MSWNDPDLLAKVARAAPYLFIVLGFLVAFSGQYVRDIIETRITTLQEVAERERRNTPAQVSVSAGYGATNDKLLLELEAQNDIPFKVNWYVLTRDNKVASGIPIERIEVVPSATQRRFLFPLQINDDAVVDDYVEIVVNFESAYSAELNHPDHLKGTIRKRYRYSGGKLFPWATVSLP